MSSSQDAPLTWQAPQSPDRVVAVTGARGFIGSHLMDSLRQHGYSPRAVSRESLDAIQHSSSDLRRALAGAQAVVHLAGRAHVPGENAHAAAALQAANVQLTRALYTECVHAGIAKFLFLSSVAAAAVEADEVLTETGVERPTTAYGLSKLRAEQALGDLALAGGPGIAILRPPMVYGPGMKGNPLSLMKLVAARIPLPLGAVRNNRRSLVYVTNLAAAIICLLDRSPDRYEIFYIKDPTDVSTRTFAYEMGRALGRPTRFLNIPIPLLQHAARAADATIGTIGYRSYADALRRLTTSLVVDSSKFHRATDFIAPYSLEDGLGITAKWFLADRG